MDYYLVLKNDILPFTTTWIDVEDIMLSEICQRKINSISAPSCQLALGILLNTTPRSSHQGSVVNEPD